MPFNVISTIRPSFNLTERISSGIAANRTPESARRADVLEVSLQKSATAETSLERLPFTETELFCIMPETTSCRLFPSGIVPVRFIAAAFRPFLLRPRRPRSPLRPLLRLHAAPLLERLHQLSDRVVRVRPLRPADRAERFLELPFQPVPPRPRRRIQIPKKIPLELVLKKKRPDLLAHFLVVNFRLVRIAPRACGKISICRFGGEGVNSAP